MLKIHFEEVRTNSRPSFLYYYYYYGVLEPSLQMLWKVIFYVISYY